MDPKEKAYRARAKLLKTPPSEERRDQLRDILQATWPHNADWDINESPSIVQNKSKPSEGRQLSKTVPMVDAVVITLFTQVSLRTPSELKKLLQPFEKRAQFVPQTWGVGERARSPFSRKAMLDALKKGPIRVLAHFERRGKLGYQVWYSCFEKGINDVHFEFENVPQHMLKDIFALATELADNLKPEFGFVLPICKSQNEDYQGISLIRRMDFEDCGPNAVAARTWFGPHMLRLIGRKLLNDGTAIVKTTKWKGVQLDLVQDPWNANPKTLESRHAAMMKRLRPSKVFGDYSDDIQCKCGRRFVPLPGTIRA